MKSGFESNNTVLFAFLLVFACSLFIAEQSFAEVKFSECPIKNSNGTMTTPKSDRLYQVLQQVQKCPSNVQEFKSVLMKVGNASHASMVANRGIHNPDLGSFSFFETVVSPEADLFFGHFTGVANGVVILDQAPTPGKLMIELIAWDSVKKLYNFYELIGTGRGGEWFYRGDSKAILQDNASLHMNPTTLPPVFGKTLRCSACHTSGGPIMKEISAPHNDWWTQKRPLDFGKNKLSAEVSKIVADVQGAERFTQTVRQGIQKLESSPQYQKLKSSMSVRAQLRPLFCEMEINLMSDAVPLQVKLESVQIPSASLVNPLLKQQPITVSRKDYQELLVDFQMKFPETSLADADHAWLTPVKGYSDLLAIQSLIGKGVISSEFAMDVLAIDAENPIFSEKRCSLLQLVPASGNFQEFKQALKSSEQPEAKELVANFEDPKRNSEFHSLKAQDILARAQTDLKTKAGQKKYFARLLSQRQAVFTSVISKNPRGQILEPGFRVIFPEPSILKAL